MRTLLAVSLALVLLTGCASDPETRLRDDAAAVVEAANARDADAVRDRAADLEETVAELAADGSLPQERAERLTALARSLVTSADVIDEELLEQRRQEAETEAERKRLEEEARRLEEERQRLEEERKKAEEEARKKAEEEAKKAEEEDEEQGKGKGKGNKDDEEDEEGGG